MAVDDGFDLERFVEAQAPVFETVLRELAAGRKRTHWMWFVFPQLRSLGRSPTAQLYGIASLAEARAYLAHPVLGPRLDQATRVVTAVADRTLHAIFGSPDDIKFCSSMTLFLYAAGDGGAPFRHALDRFCDGRADAKTEALLATGGPSLISRSG